MTAPVGQPSGRSPLLRDCTVCGEPIPPKRLEIKPNATHCVPCLEAAGDVPRIKRFDQATKDGIIEVTYTSDNAAMEQAVARLNTLAAPNDAYEQAVGDDSFLVRETEGGVVSAYKMSEAFEQESVSDTGEVLQAC